MSAENAILAALAALNPAMPALDDGTLKLSYGDVQRSVTQEKRWLSGMGVSRCAMLADNSARWVISDLALLALGATHIPLPAYFSSAQVSHVLEDAAIDHVLTDRPEQMLCEHPQFIAAGRSHRTGFAVLERRVAMNVASDAAIAKVTYTSGSTGVPKGVCLSMQTIEAVAQSLAAATASLGITRHMCLLPLPTLLENIAGVYVPLLIGARVNVQPLATIGMSYGRLDAAAMLRAIAQVQPESLVLVPELLRVLLHGARTGWRPPASLRFIAVGGASVSPELLEQAEAAGLPVYEGYGLSECASVVCLNTPAHRRPGSVGKPLSHARVRINAAGEICVAGATMSGYLGESRNGVEEIRTGDLGWIDADGFVYVRGRAKNMFITSMGRNVTPEWVERELTCEPQILQALVHGEARPFPVALIAAPPGVADAVVDAALERANARLPDYARVQRWARFPETPSVANGWLTANGRLRRAQIVASCERLIDSLYVFEDDYADELS